MSLGNEASTEPRLNLRLANSLGATNNGGRWRAEGLPRRLHILLNGPPQRRHLSYRRNCQNGSMNLCAVALVK